MKKFVVISHTHWDREWYMSFSSFRLKLVDLVDRLMDIIENDDTYIFHLDAQTVVLEDYLELRPHRRDELKEYITKGNIIVGPWYLQNDFYLTAGEATVRNLQIGSAVARDFGKCSNVGYAPDQFGNVSQLPQILKGFGVDNFVFGRGFTKLERVDGNLQAAKMPAEFVWEGADGTKALAIHLKYWYNNAQHIPEELRLAELLLDINERNFEGLNVSPYVLLMNGVDHLEAQADVKDIILQLQQAGRDITQCSLDEYVENLKKAVEGKEMQSYKGALNLGEDYSILKGCWSSRIYLKRENVKAQDLLINKLEPLYSYLEANGFKNVYPTCEMEYLWKNLLKNHPHDSICGCSIDSVHKHMEDSFEKIADMGGDLLLRGMKTLSLHVEHKYKDDKNYSVTVFNSTEKLRSGVVEVSLNIPAVENAKGFIVYDANGKEIPYEIVSNKKVCYDVFSPLNLPGVLDVDRITVRFYAEDVPALSASVYAFIVNGGGKTIPASKECNCLENEFYQVTVVDGQLVIKDKKNAKTYVNPIMLEDSVDRGDAYVYKKSPDAPVVIKPTGFKFTNGGLKGDVTFKFEYNTPKCYDFKNRCVSTELVKEVVECTLTIEEYSDVISLNYNIINTASDHRLRLMLNSGIAGGVISTDSAFDYDARKPFESCVETDSNTHNNETFFEVSNGENAMAVFTEGQHEVEYYNGEYALVSILRCTAIINRNPITLEGSGEVWEVPANQCLREVYGRLAISYGAKRSGAELWSKAKFFRNGFICLANSFDYKKYSGGRFAVQSAELEKLYYVPDKYANCLVKANGFIKLENENVAITCVKRGICGGIVLRFVNLSNETVTEQLNANAKIYLTNLAENTFEEIGEGSAKLTFTPKQIITIKLEYADA